MYLIYVYVAVVLVVVVNVATVAVVNIAAVVFNGIGWLGTIMYEYSTSVYAVD